jgi:hypothetical protein
MKNWMLVSLILISLVIIMGVSGCSAPATNSNADNTAAGTGSNIQKTADGKIICADPSCLGQNFASCTPAQITMSSEGQSITITIHGLVNEKCHFTMVFGNVTAADCYFNKADLTDKVLNQMFGNKEGQDAIISAACNQ